MKIYELRIALEDSLMAIQDEPGDEQIEQYVEAVLDPSRLFTSLERAKAAAQEEQEELHIESLSQEEIDSTELSDNLLDELEWTHEAAREVWSACCGVLGAHWVIRTHEVDG